MLPIILLPITGKESVFCQDAFRIKFYFPLQRISKQKKTVMEWNAASQPLEPLLIMELSLTLPFKLKFTLCYNHPSSIQGVFL